MTKNREQFEEQLMDLALTEKVGGKQPPDLSEKILRDAGDESPRAAQRWRTRRARVAEFLPYAVSASLLFVLAVAASVWRPEYPAKQHAEIAQLDNPQNKSLLHEFEEDGRFLDAVEVEQQLVTQRIQGEIEPALARLRQLRASRRNASGQTATVDSDVPDPYPAGLIHSIDDVDLRFAERSLELRRAEAERYMNAIRSVEARERTRLAQENQAAPLAAERIPEEIRNAQTKRHGLVVQNSDVGRVMDAHGLAIHWPVNNTPALDGVITLVSTKNLNYVQISVGKDDGLRVGHELIVYRKKSYLGRAIIRKVDPNAAVAEITIRQGEIKKGDLVTTRFLGKPRKKDEKRTWRRAKATANAARLVVGDKDELLSDGMQVNVVIDGFRARVLLDYYFYNDRQQQLEGAFKLRLPNEASLFYFAFGETKFEYRPQVDELATAGFLNSELVRASGANPKDIFELRSESWQRVKEARMVPRERASYAYSETTRRRIDPALVEWTGAGVFNAKVFPLAPNKLHRIVIGYDVNLRHDGDDLVYKLLIPEDRSECFVDLNLSSVPGVAASVTPTQKPFAHNGRSYYRFKNPKADAITVRMNQPKTTLISGSDSETGDFFAVEVQPQLPADGKQVGSSHAVFLLDTSLSSNPERFNLWLKLLRATLEKNRDTIKQFAVLYFNIESHWWQQAYVENSTSNVEKLLNDCNKLSLEGATDLRQALAEAASPPWAIDAERARTRPDLFLLSDGAVTWGETNLHLIAKDLNSKTIGPLFAYKTGMAGTAAGVLDHLARQSGGAVFSVTSEEEIDRAATAHRQRPWRLSNVAVAGGKDLLVAGRPESIYPGQRLLIVGRGSPARDAEITVRVRRGDEVKNIRIPVESLIHSQLTPRLYGHVAVGQLENLYSAAEEIATAYARHFRVTGSTCSLLMLETEEDYQRFNIKPEDDALVVKTSLASSVVAKTLDEIGQRLENAKQSLIHWLGKMEAIPGVKFKVPTALRLVVDQMPPEAFDVKIPPLNCKLRQHASLPKEFGDVLAAHHRDSSSLDYNAISAEAARRSREFGPADALKALSSLVEDNPGDVVLTRDVAFSAMGWDLGGQAYSLLRRAADARPYEPQTYQAIGRCLAELGHIDLAMIYYEVALAGKWHGRFGDFRRIVGVEYLHLLRQIHLGELTCHAADYANARFASLAEEFDLSGTDLVVTMMWNTDRTDVDLYVTEPSGETCNYQQTHTKSGGAITTDVREGFGPEMYTLRKAPSGEYQIAVEYFNSDENRTSTRTKVYLTMYQNYGTERERKSIRTVTLDRPKEILNIVTITVKN